MGHCSSYDEIEQVETSLANESLAKADVSGVIIPTNINPGAFIQMAADNNNINEETTDSKNTTHTTTLAIYKRKQYGPTLERLVHGDHSKKRRSLDSTRHLVVLEDVNMGGRHPGLPDFAGEVISSWFTCDCQFLSTCMDDLCWMLLRLSDPFMACNQVQSPEDKKIPGWSGFHAITHPGIPVETNIGYHPMMNAEASNFSTLCTMMKLAQNICNTKGQCESVITFDLALYAKAKQLQMKYPEEYGGFHNAQNYLSLLGRKYANSSLEDLLIESGVYAAGTTSILMLGKSYNRGIRAHKLVMEALFRPLWKAFLEWLSKKAGALVNELKQDVVRRSSECQSTIKMNGFVNDAWLKLQGCVEPLFSLLDALKSESKEKPKAFSF